MDEIVKDFLIESNENLDRLDQELVKLESEPSSKELLASVFRTIHTIKGSCGFLGFARLEKLAHAGESLLSRLRDGKLNLSAEITSGSARHGGRGSPDAGGDSGVGSGWRGRLASLIELLAQSAGRQAPAARRCPQALLLPDQLPKHRVQAEFRSICARRRILDECSPPPDPRSWRRLEQDWSVPETSLAALEIQEKSRHTSGEILRQRSRPAPTMRSQPSRPSSLAIRRRPWKPSAWASLCSTA